MQNIWQSIFSLDPAGLYAGFGGAGLLAGLIFGLAARGDGWWSLLRALEAGLTAAAGAFLARGFTILLFWWGGEGEATTLAVSLLLFIWPGIVNLFALLSGGELAISANGLLWTALFSGGLVGLYDGVFRVHRWLGPGPVAFLLDVTWGLPLSIHGLMLHIVNTGWGDHTPDERQDAHLYRSGFHLASGSGGAFAFTQGSVISALGTNGPGSGLFGHELLHVWQNRILGPFFWFTYAGWIVVMLIPALAFALIGGRHPGAAVMWWTYYNNPWEAIAYGAGGHRSDPDGWLCWPPAACLIVGLLVAGVLVIAELAIVRHGGFL